MVGGPEDDTQRSIRALQARQTILPAEVLPSKLVSEVTTLLADAHDTFEITVLTDERVVEGLAVLIVGTQFAGAPIIKHESAHSGDDPRMMNVIGKLPDSSKGDPQGGAYKVWFTYKHGAWEVHYSRVPARGNTRVMRRL